MARARADQSRSGNAHGREGFVGHRRKRKLIAFALSSPGNDEWASGDLQLRRKAREDMHALNSSILPIQEARPLVHLDLAPKVAVPLLKHGQWYWRVRCEGDLIRGEGVQVIEQLQSSA